MISASSALTSVDVSVPGFWGGLLGGSWVVISGVISKVTIVITHIRGLIVILISTHEPPSIEPLLIERKQPSRDEMVEALKKGERTYLNGMQQPLFR